MQNNWLALFFVGFMLSFVTQTEATTLERVKERGRVVCGVSKGVAGFASPDKKGVWKGMDIDNCKALAAAVLGDAEKVQYSPLGPLEQFTALIAGEVDVLLAKTPWTFKADTALGVRFTGVTYYDDFGILMANNGSITTLKKLNNTTLCVAVGREKEQLVRYLHKNAVNTTLVEVSGEEQAKEFYTAGKCQAIAGWLAWLYGQRSTLASSGKVGVLQERIAYEASGPYVRQGDDGWFNLVRWVTLVPLAAESLGVSSENIDHHLESKDTTIRRLLGLEGLKGLSLGLSADWAAQVIRQVGNYQEIFDRNVGEDTQMDIPRTSNRLWNDGGMHFVPAW